MSPGLEASQRDLDTAVVCLGSVCHTRLTRPSRPGPWNVSENWGGGSPFTCMNKSQIHLSTPAFGKITSP